MINAKEILQRHCFISEEFVVRKCKTLDELITENFALYGNLYIHEAKISDELYERICLENGKDKGAGYNCMYSAPLCIITQGMIHQPVS